MTLREQLIRDEGMVLHAYEDSRGYMTIGVGRLIDARLGGGITRTEAYYLLDSDIARASAAVLARLPWTAELDEVRRAALINLSFNMGIGGLLTFRKMLAAMQAQQWAVAAIELLNSDYHAQVGGRAERLADQVATGEWR